MQDVIIIGGSFAGLTAAMAFLRQLARGAAAPVFGSGRNAVALAQAS